MPLSSIISYIISENAIIFYLSHIIDSNFTDVVCILCTIYAKIPHYICVAYTSRWGHNMHVLPLVYSGITSMSHLCHLKGVVRVEFTVSDSTENIKLLLDEHNSYSSMVH